LICWLQQRDLFKEFQLPSIKTLREYIKITKAKVAAENRWTDANGTVRSNLSDHAGDLSPLAKVVQNILLDEEEAEATREEVRWPRVALYHFTASAFSNICQVSWLAS
jgi:hypothetical protein